MSERYARLLSSARRGKHPIQDSLIDKHVKPELKPLQEWSMWQRMIGDMDRGEGWSVTLLGKTARLIPRSAMLQVVYLETVRTG
jgi:hypothetical protein